jgi:hypothetical protein
VRRKVKVMEVFMRKINLTSERPEVCPRPCLPSQLVQGNLFLREGQRGVEESGPRGYVHAVASTSVLLAVR